jgi:excisionase family DNA binding protein
VATVKKVLTLAEAASFLQVHPITLYRMLKADKLPGAFRAGRVWRFNREGLERFARAEGEQRGTGEVDGRVH